MRVSLERTGIIAPSPWLEETGVGDEQPITGRHRQRDADPLTDSEQVRQGRSSIGREGSLGQQNARGEQIGESARDHLAGRS